MPSNLPPLDFGKNSLLVLGLKVFDEQCQAKPGVGIGKVGREGAQRIVDFAAKDGLTFQESRSLALLSQDTFTFSARGKEVVDQFLAGNPVPPPADGAERVSRTERVVNRVAADGKVSFQDVAAIRDTFSRIDATPDTLAQQVQAAKSLLDRTDLKFTGRSGPLGGEYSARDELMRLVKDFGG